jgi:hypothetical protein
MLPESREKYVDRLVSLKRLLTSFMRPTVTGLVGDVRAAPSMTTAGKPRSFRQVTSRGLVGDDEQRPRSPPPAPG